MKVCKVSDTSNIKYALVPINTLFYVIEKWSFLFNIFCLYSTDIVAVLSFTIPPGLIVTIFLFSHLCFLVSFFSPDIVYREKLFSFS